MYRGDGVQRVLDGQQQHFVPAVGVVGVGGPRDAFAGGVVEVGLLSGDVDGLLRSTRHAAVSARNLLELHQSLPLERHHHHVTAGEQQNFTKTAAK